MKPAYSYECDHLVLPKESRNFLKQMNGHMEDVNLYLLQNRFCYKKKPDEKARDNKLPKYGSLLAAAVRSNCEDSTNIYENKASDLMKHLNDRNTKIAGTFKCSSCCKFKPSDKLIVGDGGSVYLDVQPLRLHLLYGIPYIPASAIKGTLRSVWVLERYGGDEEKAERDDDFVLLFGGKRSDDTRLEGKLSFFDIYPEKFTIGLDVQTVHYDDYYNKPRKQPTDDQNPKPVFFICLRKAEFPILIACNDEEVWLRRLKEIRDMMYCMLTQYGIGAKTAVGYGRGEMEWE